MAKNFEENISELEEIINTLESGNAPLDKCIELFENGVKLSNECLKMLNDAQKRIVLLTEKGEQKFDTKEENEDE